MRLDSYSSIDFDRGASRFVEALWVVVGALLIGSWIPGSSWRKILLRLFGAQIEPGVVIKPRVRVKFPWRLELGAHCWVGEGVWIDNLASVRIGEHACVSQGAYLCTGSHDCKKETFDLIISPIEIGANAWVGAFCKLAPGTKMGEGTVLTIGSTAKGVLGAWSFYSGHFAVHSGPRPKT